MCVGYSIVDPEKMYCTYHPPASPSLNLCSTKYRRTLIPIAYALYLYSFTSESIDIHPLTEYRGCFGLGAPE